MRSIASRLFPLRLRIDGRVPASYKFMLTLRLLFQMARGLFTCVRRSSLGPLFRAERVRILSGLSITVGTGVRLGSDVVLDGLGEEGIRIGSNVKIGDFSRLICSGTISNLGRYIELGDRVGLGEFSRIGGSGGVRIGNDTIIGQYFSAHPENHNYSNKQVLIRDQGTTRSEIIVGENCWIGAKVSLLAGTRVGHSCVIAAGSVVSGVFPPYSVIGGVPARILKSY